MDTTLGDSEGSSGKNPKTERECSEANRSIIGKDMGALHLGDLTTVTAKGVPLC